MRRILAASLVILLALGTLALYLYISQTEAVRTYTPIRMERAAQLGTLVQHSLENFVKPGQPLNQFSGFDQEIAGTLFSDPAFLAARLVDIDGIPVFCHGRESSHCADPTSFHWDQFTGVIAISSGDEVLEGNGRLMLVKQIRDKLGPVGSLEILLDREIAIQVIHQAFTSVVTWTSVLFALFACLVMYVEISSSARARKLVKRLFLSLQAAIILLLCYHLFNIYQEGKSGQVDELAASMARRISAVADLGLPLDSVIGLSDVMAEYRQVNPDISGVYLQAGDQSLLLSDQGDRNDKGFGTGFELLITAPVRLIGDDGARLVMTMPYSKLLLGVWDGARGMLTLLFGCTLLGSALMTAVHAYRERGHQLTRSEDAHSRMDIILPAYLMGVMVDAMIWPILPDYSRGLVAAEGLSPYWIQLPFTLYFLALTAALIPAGRLIHAKGDRRTFEIGAASVAGGLVLLAMTEDFSLLCLGRILTGFGQGMLLVTIQDIAFRTLPQVEKTRAASVQVLGYTTGVIAGSGFGGLIASFHDFSATLTLAAICGAAVLAYAFLAVKTPDADMSEHSAAEVELGKLSELMGVLKDRQFLGILMTVGIISKFALTGIVMFAMPFLMIEVGYLSDSVGQALMFYSIVVYGTTRITPYLGRVWGGERPVIALGLGCLIFGVLGLVLAAGTGSVENEVFGFITVAIGDTGRILALIAAIILLGLGQGLTASPAISVISSTLVAQRAGQTPILALYRVLERAGHMAGPALVGILMAASHGSAAALLPVAGGFLLAACLFGLFVRRSHK